MKNKNKVIICLLAVAVILFLIIQLAIIPAQQNRKAEYAKNQTDALSHDITAIEDFKSSYVGDATNISNLFYALPLNNIQMKFQINSDTCALTVNYLDTVWNIGEEKVNRDLLYNAVAAMAAVDNLSVVTFEFSGASFSFERADIEKVFGTPLSDLLEKEVWKENVQEQIASQDFVNQFYP